MVAEHATVLCVGLEPADLSGDDRPVSVRTVDSAEAALDAAADADCVVAASDLPDSNGIELRRRLERRDLLVPFVLSPATTDGAEASAAVEAGVDAYVPRDLDAAETRLWGQVADLLDRNDREVFDRTFFESVLEGLGVGVGVYDETGRFVYVNPAYADLLDRDRWDLLDTPVWAVNPEFDAEQFEAYWASFAVGETRQTESRHVTPDGETFPVETHTTAVKLGSERYNIGTITDIRERVRDREELERQNDRLAEFASVVSHDLRNPLNVAQGRLELLASAVDSEHVDPIERSLDRMGELIEQILRLTREGRVLESPEPVALREVVERAWETAGDPSATLSVTTLGTVRGDESRLQRLFENLFRNAVEHGTPDDVSDLTVTVGRLAEPESDGFYVADDGQGFAAADRDRLFDHGYTMAEDGTGLGLAIVAEIAEAHGWTVSATAGRAGGASFEVTGVDWE